MVVEDLTDVVRPLWEERRKNADCPRDGYSILLDDRQFGLGGLIFYIYVRGTKSAR